MAAIASAERVLSALARSDTEAALDAQRALTTQGLRVEALVELASAWRHARVLLVARALAEAARERCPEHPGALNELGLTLHGLGDLHGALEPLLEGRRRYPEAAEFCVSLACVHQSLRDLSSARRELERALELAPGQGLALRNLALVALAEHDLPRAVSAAEAALAAGPRDLDSRRILIEAARLQGQRERARGLIAENLREDPGHAGTLFERGHLEQREAHYAAAEKTFAEANAAARPSNLEPFSAFRARLDPLWAVYDAIAKKTDRPSCPPVDRNAPVLIVGAPRSGTTLLERMLDLHPALHGEEEPMWLQSLLQQVSMMAGRPVGPELLLEELWVRGNQPLLEALRRRYRELVGMTRAAEAGLWPIDKLPANVFYLGIFAALVPGVAVVHIIRDGREVAWSSYTQAFHFPLSHAFDPLDAIAHWKQGILHARRSAEIFPVRYLEIRYESLVDDPEAVLRRVLEHLDLQFDARCLTPEASRKASATMSHAQVREGVHRRSLRKAVHYPEVYAAMTDAEGPLLRELGYEAWDGSKK